MKNRKKHFISRTELSLLRNRDICTLTLTEFTNLLRSHNAVGAREEAFTTARLATKKFPSDPVLLRWHRDTARGWLAGSDLIAEFLQCIDKNIGPNSFWRLALVDCYIDAAWAEDFDMLSARPRHPECLFLAAQQLESAQITELDFRRYWGRSAVDPQATYEMAFEGLLRYEAFAHLRRLR